MSAAALTLNERLRVLACSPPGLTLPLTDREIAELRVLAQRKDEMADICDRLRVAVAAHDVARRRADVAELRLFWWMACGFAGGTVLRQLVLLAIDAPVVLV